MVLWTIIPTALRIQMKASEIRQKFVQFFERNGHDHIPSSSLIPENDPTLLFANAGMNQFKDFFIGAATPKNRRAVSVQKCVRAGGKHNDLENVGFTARHQTFFEMLGNFSFGDYFKKEAIRLAWDFLTKELKIPEAKLYITVHDSDDEAHQIWHKEIGIPNEKIFRMGDKDNFWEMGEFGPCGPCSEIFYDHGPEYADPNYNPKTAKNLLEDESRYVEIWNLVFMQFEKTPEGTQKLPSPSIDTGAGLERLAAALQGVYYNYDSDLFLPIIHKLERLSGKSYQDQKWSGSMRVVADHIRSSVMLITDGVLPSNEGGGYVLRRIIRRAIRHLRNLGLTEPTMYKLVPQVFEILGDTYVSNQANANLASVQLESEEKSFLETLDVGLKYLDQCLKKELEGDTLKGSAAFKLYDTYGFPVDLTQVILDEKGLKVDTKGFETCMQEQKERSRKSWKGSYATQDLTGEYYKAKEVVPEVKFQGYDQLSSSATLKHIIKKDDFQILIFDQTPFYAESGGQAADVGDISLEGTILAEVKDVQKPVDGLIVHFVDGNYNFEKGKVYDLTVDEPTRKLTMKNHSATHLLQAALREKLGEHVKQAGSMVTHQKLRFDFTHIKKLSDQDLASVEARVNKAIIDNLEVQTQLMGKEEAIKSGAMANFGDKYGDKVRVLNMGDGFSVELCGGTHVANTKDIQFFTIISEGSLSNGVRRIEALTAGAAETYLQTRSDCLMDLAEIMGTSHSLSPKEASEELKIVEALFSLKDPDKLRLKVKELYTEIVELSKELEEKRPTHKKQFSDYVADLVKTRKKWLKLKKQKEGDNQHSADDLFKNLFSLSSDFQYCEADAPEGANLRNISDQFVDKYPTGILLLTSKSRGKISVLIRTHKQNKQIDCAKILKETLPMLEGRGGGRPDMAQGSGSLEEKFEDFKQTVKNTVKGLF